MGGSAPPAILLFIVVFSSSFGIGRPELVLQYPRLLEATFKRAPKARAAAVEQLKFDGGE